MALLSKGPGLIFAVFLAGLAGQVNALEILHFIEGKDHARVMKDATGLKITDAGVVYVTSEEKGTLLKIVDGKVQAISLSPPCSRTPILVESMYLPMAISWWSTRDRGRSA
jgi:hypothetical protein